VSITSRTLYGCPVLSWFRPLCSTGHDAGLLGYEMGPHTAGERKAESSRNSGGNAYNPLHIFQVMVRFKVQDSYDGWYFAAGACFSREGG